MPRKVITVDPIEGMSVDTPLSEMFHILRSVGADLVMVEGRSKRTNELTQLAVLVVGKDSCEEVQAAVNAVRSSWPDGRTEGWTDDGPGDPLAHRPEGEQLH